jgi:hypothetical protein
VDISLLLFTRMIIQLLMGGKNFFLYVNAQAHTKGWILQQYKHNNKGLFSMVAPFPRHPRWSSIFSQPQSLAPSPYCLEYHLSK